MTSSSHQINLNFPEFLFKLLLILATSILINLPNIIFYNSPFLSFDLKPVVWAHLHALAHNSSICLESFLPASLPENSLHLSCVAQVWLPMWGIWRPPGRLRGSYLSVPMVPHCYSLYESNASICGMDTNIPPSLSKIMLWAKIVLLSKSKHLIGTHYLWGNL